MKPDGADTNPAAEPGRPQRDKRPNKSDAHSETGSIVLNAPVTGVYGHCCRFEQLPQFIKSLRSAQKIDDTHFRLTTFEGSEQQRIILQIVLRVPERRIAWQASCSEFSQGVILFEPLTVHRTEVTVKLRSTIEPAMLAQLTREYLTNFKQFVEGQMD
jgi:uncharacterized membrane protein